MNTLSNAKKTVRHETCPAYCNSLLKVEGLIWPDGSWVEMEKEICGCISAHERKLERDRNRLIWEKYHKGHKIGSDSEARTAMMDCGDEDHTTDEESTDCDQCGEKMVRSDGGGIWSDVLCVCNKCAPNQGE